jgi:hypothetical protein
MRQHEPADLDRLADRGWPALEREELGGWTLRAADGVTNRANSVLTCGEVPDVEAAIERAERWYREGGLPAVFQVSLATPPALVAALSDLPAPGWLATWWAVVARVALEDDWAR